MARRIGEPFPLPLFCPECFAPIDNDNAMLYPTGVNDSGVGCGECWVNPLCPAECNGIHGAPVPRGARRNLRRYSVPGTWECPTTEEAFRFTGRNCEESWNDLDNWSPDRWNDGSFLNPERDEWYESESEWHEEMGHEYCEGCDEYVDDYDRHYDEYHAEPDYDNDDYYPGESSYADRPIGEWLDVNATHYNPITEQVADYSAGNAPSGWVPIHHFESLVAA